MSIYAAVKKWFEPGPTDASLLAPAPDGRKEDRLRADAESILRSAIEAIEPRALVTRAMEARERGIPGEGKVWVAGFGTAAVPMAQGLSDVLGDRIEAGVLVVPPRTANYVSPSFDVFYGGHPLPDQGSVAAANAIRQLAREAGDQDLLICLMSGGGSSLMTLPPETLPLEDIREVTALLGEAGATPEELNCVRKHLDQLKGGRLTRLAAPARVLALVLSDVAGDPLDVIASGPAAPDPTRFQDAVGVLKRHRVWKQVPLAARGYLDRGVCGEIEDTPTKSDPVFLRATNVIVGSAHTAAGAACAEAESLGYDSQLLTTSLDGPARDAGGFLAETAKILHGAQVPGQGPTCIVTAGETRMPGGTRNAGRNQEVALGAALAIADRESILVASMDTAGVDGDTEAAGAIATGSTCTRAAAAGLDCRQSLDEHRAYGVFEALGDLIVSGPTGTNVADLQVVLID